MYKAHYITEMPEYEVFMQNHWMRVTSSPELITFNLSFSKAGSIRFDNFLHLIEHDNYMISFVYIYNELNRNGLKMIKLTKEQCIVLSQIKLGGISIDDYHQPYETVGIEIPDDYRDWLRKKYKGCTPPKMALVHHKQRGKKDEDGNKSDNYENYILTSYYVDDMYPIISTFITEGCTDLENLIGQVRLKDQGDIDIAASQDLMRLALNINILITQFGMEKWGYENPKRYRALKREGRGRERGEIYWVGLNQEIKLFEKRVWSGERRGPLDEERRSPHPHFRHGYMRRQHYGPRNEKVKIIFIRPVFVCSEAFKGDISDTTVVFD